LDANVKEDTAAGASSWFDGTDGSLA